ncbi:hypothetical protein [Kordiimonas sp.]|uniref:hypothetical protein n=1 Tax=Kordiimonas sp. TaxID=1970157 RepID=UPI003A92A8B0
MSDISGGAPMPKVVDPVARATDKASGVSKDPQRSETQAREHSGERHAKNDRAEAHHARDPAVSISASAAHIEVGERLKREIAKVDLEGRPIIVTERATYALRPDAGLRAGDDVELEIVEAGKKVSADLLVKNNQVIDPPIRLSLVVIAIHAPEDSGQTPRPDLQNTGPAYTGKRPPQSVAQSVAQNTPQVAQPDGAETLANLIGARASTLPNALENKPVSNYSAVPPQSRPIFGDTSATPIADNPDKIGPRSNSSDLATLIAAQQGQAPKTPLYQSVSTQVPPSGERPDGAHFIPKSELTSLQAPQQAFDNAGLSAPIQAFTASGDAKIIQLMDPAISRVPPSQVATVLTVHPLAPEDAKVLPLPVAKLADPTSPLARVETTQGTLIVSLKAAENLNGEQVRITTLAPAPAAPEAPNAAPGYKARLQPPGMGVPKNIIVSFPEQGSENQTLQNATVKAVHTVRAFMSPDGPRSDLRLDTTRGMITISLPNAVRPAVGDILQFPLPTQETAPLPPSMPYSGTPMAPTAAVVPEAGTLAALSHTAWPALHQSMTFLSGSDPTAAAELATRSADGGGKLTNSLLFFLSAAGRNSPEAWLGGAAEKALAEHSRALLDALKGDLSRLMGMATEPVGEWRQLMLPLDMRNPDMPLIAMLFGHGPQVDPDRQHGGQNQNQGDEKDELQRFILEVQFTVLGPVQLDGLIRGQKFDLTLRTSKPLPSSLKHDAIRLFDDALGASAFTGQLNILEQSSFPVDVEAILNQGSARAR